MYVLGSWYLDALLTLDDPLVDQLPHIRMLVVLSVRNFCLDDSGMFTNFSVQVPEYLIKRLLQYEFLMKFYTTSFSVNFLEQYVIFEAYAIVICFLVYVFPTCHQ